MCRLVLRPRQWGDGDKRARRMIQPQILSFLMFIPRGEKAEYKNISQWAFFKNAMALIAFVCMYTFLLI